MYDTYDEGRGHAPGRDLACVIDAISQTPIAPP